MTTTNSLPKQVSEDNFGVKDTSLTDNDDMFVRGD